MNLCSVTDEPGVPTLPTTGEGGGSLIREGLTVGQPAIHTVYPAEINKARFVVGPDMLQTAPENQYGSISCDESMF
jgi:hypothetical protein